jgi:hypothetical protein
MLGESTLAKENLLFTRAQEAWQWQRRNGCGNYSLTIVTNLHRLAELVLIIIFLQFLGAV